MTVLCEEQSVQAHFTLLREQSVQAQFTPLREQSVQARFTLILGEWGCTLLVISWRQIYFSFAMELPPNARSIVMDWTAFSNLLSRISSDLNSS